MKNITFSVEDGLIEKARSVARSQGRTLNAAFREWLVEFTSRGDDAKEYDALMERLSHVNAGRHFSRDAMNERGTYSTNMQSPYEKKRVGGVDGVAGEGKRKGLRKGSE